MSLMANSFEELRLRLEAKYECPVTLILAQGPLNPALPENAVHLKIHLPWMAKYGEWLFYGLDADKSEDVALVEPAVADWIEHNRDLPLTEWKDRSPDGKWTPPDSYTASQRRKKQAVLDSGGTISA